MITETEIAVTFTAYEARALRHSAEMLLAILRRDELDFAHDHLPEGHEVLPLESAAMRLEMALALKQEEL